jgi:hypothetical protein
MFAYVPAALFRVSWLRVVECQEERSLQPEPQHDGYGSSLAQRREQLKTIALCYPAASRITV